MAHIKKEMALSRADIAASIDDEKRIAYHGRGLFITYMKQVKKVGQDFVNAYTSLLERGSGPEQELTPAQLAAWRTDYGLAKPTGRARASGGAARASGGAARASGGAPRGARGKNKVAGAVVDASPAVDIIKPISLQHTPHTDARLNAEAMKRKQTEHEAFMNDLTPFTTGKKPLCWTKAKFFNHGLIVGTFQDKFYVQCATGEPVCLHEDNLYDRMHPVNNYLSQLLLDRNLTTNIRQDLKDNGHMHKDNMQAIYVPAKDSYSVDIVFGTAMRIFAGWGFVEQPSSNNAELDVWSKDAKALFDFFQLETNQIKGLSPSHRWTVGNVNRELIMAKDQDINTRINVYSIGPIYEKGQIGILGGIWEKESDGNNVRELGCKIKKNVKYLNFEKYQNIVSNINILPKSSKGVADRKVNCKLVKCTMVKGQAYPIFVAVATKSIPAYGELFFSEGFGLPKGSAMVASPRRAAAHHSSRAGSRHSPSSPAAGSGTRSSSAAAAGSAAGPSSASAAGPAAGRSSSASAAGPAAGRSSSAAGARGPAAVGSIQSPPDIRGGPHEPVGVERQARNIASRQNAAVLPRHHTEPSAPSPPGSVPSTPNTPGETLLEGFRIEREAREGSVADALLRTDAPAALDHADIDVEFDADPTDDEDDEEEEEDDEEEDPIKYRRKKPRGTKALESSEEDECT